MPPYARLLLCTACLLPAWSAAPARATYSLLIADQATGLIGSVGTSCVGRQAVSAISGIAPGFGAIHAQALSNAGGRDRGVMMLKQGASASEVIEAIAAPGFDFLAASRQYGVVTLKGDAAGYTGKSNGAFAGDQQATLGNYVTSYQGNILTSQKVLIQLAESLRSGEGCDLPETLMRALEAGARNGEGDSRCTVEGIPADAGFLRVVDRDGKQLIAIEVTNQSAQGAVVALRAQFDSWRATHRCAASSDAGVGAVPVEDAGAPADAGGAAMDDAATAPPVDARVPSAREPDAPRERADAATTGTARGDAGQRDAQRDDGDEPGAAMSADEGGCSVRSTSQAGWLLALAALLVRRRRRGARPRNH